MKWDGQTIIVVCTIILAAAAIGTMMQTGFSRIDDRFDSVDARFDSVDARFVSVDARIDSIDTRLDNIDRRLGRVEGYLFGLEADPDERL